MDRREHRLIADEILAAVKSVAEKHGYAAVLRRGQFDLHGGGVFKVELAREKNGVVLDSHARDFASFAEAYGLQASDLGRSFMNGGKRYTVVGSIPRAVKNILCKTDDGRQWAFTPEIVKSLLSTSAAAR